MSALLLRLTSAERSDLLGPEQLTLATLLGALEFTMTAAYAASAFFDGEEHVAFARISIVSRTLAAVALLTLGHPLALGGVPFGILSATATAIALRYEGPIKVRIE